MLEVTHSSVSTVGGVDNSQGECRDSLEVSGGLFGDVGGVETSRGDSCNVLRDSGGVDNIEDEAVVPQGEVCDLLGSLGVDVEGLDGQRGSSGVSGACIGVAAS